MNSKSKGNIGEAMVLAEFVKQGVQVSIPYGDNARYDLVAEINGKLCRIQVKYCDQKLRNGSVCCPCSSSLNHTTNKKRTTYLDDVDYIAFYQKQWDCCCLVPIDEIGNGKTITFRMSKPQNNQQDRVHYVESYLFEKTLCVETLHDESKMQSSTTKIKSRPQCENDVAL